MNTETKRHIDAARQVLVGVVPNPASQIDQITYALIYKFMDDMDQAAIKNGDEPAFFIGDLEQFSWARIMDSRVGNQDRMNLYVTAFQKFAEAKQLPELFRNILKSAFLPYRSPEVLGLFLKEISYFDYSHPEELGNAYEYLLSIMSSQGDAGQFRTPRHIIDFIVDVINPTKDDKVLDPACGTGGFLVSSYRHILEQHDGENDPVRKEKTLTPDQRRNLMNNFEGYDIDPTMVRIAQVNMYLHQFKNPKIFQYDSLSSDERWGDKFDVILANPPFMSPKGGIKPHNKFSIQSNRSEVLFVDYIMNHLRPNGRAGIIVPEGIIFQSGIAYKMLRKNLIENGLIAVVSLPSGVFAPYSGVKTSILLIDNELSKRQSNILFVDIIDTGISLGATQKAIEKNDLVFALKIIQNFRNGKNLELNKLAFETNIDDIDKTDYNLSLVKYKKRVNINTEKPFVFLSEVCAITKGKSSSTKTVAGLYPLYLTAEMNKTADHNDFDGEGVAVPLISATGHGKAAIKRIHYLRGRFALANLLAFVQPIDIQKLSAKYLFYVLDSAKDNLAKLMKGAANVSMKTSDLGEFQIPLPSIEIQKQVTEELDSYASIISGAKQVVQNWKPKIDIDPVWKNFKLGEIVDLIRGVVYSKADEVETNGYKILRAMNITLNGTILLGDIKQISNQLKLKEQQKLKKDDIFICLASGSKEHVGKVAYIENDTDFYFGGFMGSIRTNREIAISRFIFFCLRDKKFNDYLKDTISGANINNLNSDILNKFEISLPPLAVQEQIVEKIETEKSLIDSANKLIKIYDDKTKNLLNKIWEQH